MIQISRFRCSGRASLESRRPLAAWDILPMNTPPSADNRASENHFESTVFKNERNMKTERVVVSPAVFGRWEGFCCTESQYLVLEHGSTATK